MCRCSCGHVQTPDLQARWTWPPSPWRRHPCKPQPAWRPVPGALLPEEIKGLTTGWRFGSRPEWLGPGACCTAMPTSGLGHGASVEAVSYGAPPAAWLPPQLPYALGASETVSVVPPSCSWTYSSSSTPTEHVSAWGALSDWPNPTPYREKILCIGESLLLGQDLVLIYRAIPNCEQFPHKTWSSAAFTAVRWMPLNLGGRRANRIA